MSSPGDLCRCHRSCWSILGAFLANLFTHVHMHTLTDCNVCVYTLCPQRTHNHVEKLAKRLEMKRLLLMSSPGSLMIGLLASASLLSLVHWRKLIGSVHLSSICWQLPLKTGGNKQSISNYNGFMFPRPIEINLTLVDSQSPCAKINRIEHQTSQLIWLTSLSLKIQLYFTFYNSNLLKHQLIALSYIIYIYGYILYIWTD